MNAPTTLFICAHFQRSPRLTTEIGNDENEWKKSSMPTTGGGAVNVKMRGCLREIAECNLRSFLCSPQSSNFCTCFSRIHLQQSSDVGYSQGYGFLWNCESWPESRGVVPTQCSKSAFCILHVWFGSAAAGAVGTNISSKKRKLHSSPSSQAFIFTFHIYI